MSIVLAAIVVAMALRIVFGAVVTYKSEIYDKKRKLSMSNPEKEMTDSGARPLALSREQMRALENIGVDTGDASMRYEGGELLCGGACGMDSSPAYSLPDLMAKHPKHLGDGVFLSVLYDGTDGCVMTYAEDHIQNAAHSVWGKTELDAAYEMLVWCVGKGYVKG